MRDAAIHQDQPEWLTFTRNQPARPRWPSREMIAHETSAVTGELRAS